MQENLSDFSPKFTRTWFSGDKNRLTFGPEVLGNRGNRGCFSGSLGPFKGDEHAGMILEREGRSALRHFGLTAMQQSLDDLGRNAETPSLNLHLLNLQLDSALLNLLHELRT